MRCACVVFALAVAAAVPARAAAEACPTEIAGADAAVGADVDARFRFLTATLDREARHASYWKHGWGWGLSGATVAQLGAVPLFDDDADRAGLYIGAGKSAAGAFSTFVMLRVKVTRVTATGAIPTCADVGRAELALVAAAKSERVHWFKHVEGVLLNGAGALYLGLEYDTWGKAIGGALLGITVNEMRLWTRPDGAIRDLRRYRAGTLGTSAPTTAWTITPVLAPHTHGATVTLQF